MRARGFLYNLMTHAYPLQTTVGLPRLASFKNEPMTPRFKKLHGLGNVCGSAMTFIHGIVTRCIKGGVNRVHQVSESCPSGEWHFFVLILYGVFCLQVCASLSL